MPPSEGARARPLNFHGILEPAGFPGLPTDWTYRSETFASSCPDRQLFANIFLREGKTPARALFVIHGQGEHGGRYLHFAHYLRETVDFIFVADLSGHGRSEGLRGDVPEFDEYVRDEWTAWKFFHELLSEAGGARAETHLFGHSMGGLIALRLLKAHPDLGFASATISAPLLGLKMEVPVWKRAAAQVLARVYGELQMTSDLDVTTLSRDENVQKAYLADRLVHQKATPRFFLGLQKAMAEMMGAPYAVSTPIQFQVPLGDRLVDSEKALQFFTTLTAPESSLKKYHDAQHEAFNDLGKEEFFEDLSAWIRAHPQGA